ncbi:DgyrCDS10621 [Dimorphilus gyrociliatus]|uniref:DgyrCDS10621 n=1 Tax=Dimorphilus gyrociliatus TaxID=2664684 RepID=A0A7I8W5V0_9ANNE|nr:DgyrCDS10621 [Dimorphilus gyrociliatus]
MKIVSVIWLILSFYAELITIINGEIGDFKAVTFNGYACERVLLKISCPDDYIIQITDVQFDRKPNETRCLNSNPQNITECITNSTTSLKVVQRMCNGKEKCSIPSDRNTFGIIGCQDSSPILTVRFQCEIKTYHGFSCENEGQLSIICPPKRLIITKSSFFGQKKDDKLCDSSSSNNRSCSSSSVDEYYRRLCDKRERCLLNTTFDNSCPSNSRGNYLQVEYGCLECRNSYGNDAECEFWANRGDCKKNPDWMNLYCRKACWKCDSDKTIECKNAYKNDGQCNYWASKDECRKNPAWMMPYCRKACLNCDKAENGTDCIDRDNMCPYWESIGECTKNPLWMKFNCKASCEKCYSGPAKCHNALGDDERCEFWSNIGECYRNAPYMISNCFKACSRCTPSKNTTTEDSCRDVFSPSTSCSNWAKIGECRKNPAWMIPYCKKSCNWCKNVPIRLDILGQEPIPGDTKIQTDNRTIILNKAFERSVRIQYFLAFFQNAKLIKVQLWRPINGTYELIYEKLVHPKGKDFIQTIVVEKCLVAKKGDRLGFSPEKVGDSPLAVRFNVEEASYQTAIQKKAGSFDDFNLPYSFSLSAVYDEDKC